MRNRTIEISLIPVPYEKERCASAAVTVFGNANSLHRENIRLCGVWFKFYEPEYENGRTTILAACVDAKEGSFSRGRVRFLRNMARGYVARVARKDKNNPVRTDAQ